MYKRLTILTVIIVAALCGLTALGYHAIEKWAEGLEGKRLGEFAEVAEQIRQDVKRKLDDFIKTEQNRPYTDYQYYYIPDNAALAQRQMPMLLSPLSGRLENGLAYGYFQIEPGGNVLTPNDYIIQNPTGQRVNDKLYSKVRLNTLNVKNYVVPMLSTLTANSDNINISGPATASRHARLKAVKEKKSVKDKMPKKRRGKSIASQREAGASYYIKSLQNQKSKIQVIEQQRFIAQSNIASNTGGLISEELLSQHQQQNGQVARQAPQAQEPQADAPNIIILDGGNTDEDSGQTVQVRIEPFVPLIVGGGKTDKSIFGEQVFLIRHVQIENKHFWQGFQLNENKLVEEVRKSAKQFMREGMSFELPQTKDENKENEDVAYKAILDFGFGDLILNLKDNPTLIGKQISQLRNWYFSIIAIVLLAAMLGLASLWRYAQAQIKLAQKKDDFISAVSHELRTPLTSIRMYSEMLEKNWIKSESKLAEYYRNMRQESERLSRLIENVLDFSRIQRGRKKYMFSIGDLNECIASVVEMMTPYAAQNNFLIKMAFGQLGQTAFDSDAVKQIVVNLLDNAIKYARNAKDKTVTIRTRRDNHFVLIDVEDHGPGIPHRQRKKIFEEFYRTEAEATRETTGTGLGLALVKKFAQAHNGFVEILAAKPAGTIFRVGLAT